MTYEDLLTQLTEEDERIVVMTAENRAAIRGLPSLIGERFIDVGISEMTLIGAAAGMALRGRIPVVHALATFLTMRAFEFIRTDVGIPHLPVKLIGAVPGFLSDGNGPTHQAIEDIALMRGIPGMQVFAPADNEDMLAALPHILRSPHPAYVRFNALPAAVKHAPFHPGKAEIVGTGTDVAILTYGFLFREALDAQARLREDGIHARVVNLRSLVPLDEDAVLSAVAECTLTVTVEDHFLTGGLYTILAELLLRTGQQANVLPIALDGRWFKPATLDRVLDFEGFTGVHLHQRIMAAMDERTEQRHTHETISTLFKTYL